METTKFFTLGGMREIGKATLIVEHDDEIVIMDAGIKFANSIDTGVDGIIPDYSYLKKNQKKIKGLFLTHGHDDHIGGIPFLIQQVSIPVIYGSRIAIELIKEKINEKKIRTNVEFEEINKDLEVNFKNLKIDFWTTQHSIPDSFGIRIRTPNGTIANTGDFRIDYSPIGNLTDFRKLEKIGQEGVDIFISDSTNALYPDHSPTEARILVDIEREVKNAKGKVIFASFASQVHRLQAAIEIAAKHDRKVAVFGRSMIKVVNIARKIGLINVPESTFVDKKEISKLEDKQIFILSTGSQGEELANLSRIASGKQVYVKIKNEDIIIFSSSAIPGNFMQVENLINRLYKIGANVKENKVDGMYHTSGHAYKEEHEKIFQIVKPKYFVPYHGSYRQAAVHGFTAVEQGVKSNNVLLIKNGEVILLKNHVAIISDERIDPGPIYIDSGIASKQTSTPINDRENLGRNGFINVVTVINKKTNDIIGRTKIISRGALYIKESREIINEMQKMAHGAILYIINNKKNWIKKDIKEIINKRISTYFYKIKRRYPKIITTILDYDNKKQITNIPKSKIEIIKKKN